MPSPYRQLVTMLQGFEKAKDDQNCADACNNDWMLAAKVLDRFLLWVYIAATIVLTAYFLTRQPNYDEADKNIWYWESTPESTL